MYNEREGIRRIRTIRSNPAQEGENIDFQKADGNDRTDTLQAQAPYDGVCEETGGKRPSGPCPADPGYNLAANHQLGRSNSIRAASPIRSLMYGFRTKAPAPRAWAIFTRSVSANPLTIIARWPGRILDMRR